IGENSIWSPPGVAHEVGPLPVPVLALVSLLSPPEEHAEMATTVVELARMNPRIQARRSNERFIVISSRNEGRGTIVRLKILFKARDHSLLLFAFFALRDPGRSCCSCNCTATISPSIENGRPRHSKVLQAAQCRDAPRFCSRLNISHNRGARRFAAQ